METNRHQNDVTSFIKKVVYTRFPPGPPSLNNKCSEWLFSPQLTIIDMMCYCIWVTVAASGPEVAVRWSRPLRPLFLINFPEGRQVNNLICWARTENDPWKPMENATNPCAFFMEHIAIHHWKGTVMRKKRTITGDNDVNIVSIWHI